MGVCKMDTFEKELKEMLVAAERLGVREKAVSLIAQSFELQQSNSLDDLLDRFDLVERESR